MPGIFGFIPSRMGSQRFRGKPLALINGRPMIQHVYERAKGCRALQEVFVATDHKEIQETVEGFKGKAILTKEGHRSGTDRVQEASQIIGLDGEDIVVNIQGDQPVFHPSCLDTLVAPFLEDRDLVMTTLYYPISEQTLVEDPNVVKVVVDNKGFALYFSRSPIPFLRTTVGNFTHLKHLGFYAYRKSFLDIFSSLPEGRLEAAEKLEQLRALEYGYKILALKSPYDSLEVDVPSDIRHVEGFLRGEKQ